MIGRARTAARRIRARWLPDRSPLLERELLLARASIKALGYELAREVAARNLGDARRPVPEPVRVGLGSKCTTQADIESPWLWHWCQQLGIPVLYHRKIWELAYILQVMWEHGLLAPGKRGLGFGCGQEPIPSLLAARGVEVTITDQSPDTAERGGWISTDQHLGGLEHAFHADLVDRAVFEQRVSIRYVDMNAVDPDLRDYDFCWSMCAFEHLGSLSAGQDFAVDAMKVLKPGGLAIHTTEYNMDPDGPTLEEPDLVLFQRSHLQAIGRRLEEQGDRMGLADFDAGDGPIDNFVDLPPYAEAQRGFGFARGGGHAQRMAHLRLSVAGYRSTCFGFWARRGGGPDAG